MSPRGEENKALFNSDMNLWDSCNVVNLTTNFRVGVGSWNDTLSRIRFGEQNDEDYVLLKSRYTTNFRDRDNWDDAIHTFFSNKEVFVHNKQMLKKINEKLIIIEAERPKKKKTPATSKGTIDTTSFVDMLELKKGALVMMVHNVDISDGLVNGVTGRVLNFVYRNIRGKNEIFAVIVEFEDPEIGQQCRKDNINIHDDVKNGNGVPLFKTNIFGFEIIYPFIKQQTYII